MSTAAALLLVALLSPLLAFTAAWALSRAIRESATVRGARRLALITVVAIQLFLVGFVIHTEGFGLRVLGTVLAASLLTWQAWAQLRRATAAPPGGQAAVGPTPPTQ